MTRSEVILNDALLAMREMKPRSVDCVIVDPPFSSGTRREGQKGIRKSMNRSTEDEEWFKSDSLSTNGFVWLMRACALEWTRLLKQGGHVLCFIDWRMYPNLTGAIESADLRHAGLIVWDKTHFGMGSCFRNQHELIAHFTLGVGNPPQRRDVPNVIQCKPVRGGEHDTEKPVELIETLLSVVCPPGGVALDCFAGSGTLAVSCEKTGRKGICVEAEPMYHALASTRAEVQTETPSLFQSEAA